MRSADADHYIRAACYWRDLSRDAGRAEPHGGVKRCRENMRWDAALWRLFRPASDTFPTISEFSPMQSSIPPNAKPGSAFDVISQRLAAINVFAARPGASDAELIARAGTVCATTAANIVAQISNDKRLNRAAKTKAGGEALAFALMADLLMRHVASMGAPATTEGGKA